MNAQQYRVMHAELNKQRVKLASSMTLITPMYDMF